MPYGRSEFPRRHPPTAVPPGGQREAACPEGTARRTQCAQGRRTVPWVDVGALTLPGGSDTELAVDLVLEGRRRGLSNLGMHQ
jgi:hypothetical protein